MGAEEQRSVQIKRGAEELAPSGSLRVIPCAYEHFALIAAAGSPERFTVLPAAHTPVTAACPRVEAVETR